MYADYIYKIKSLYTAEYTKSKTVHVLSDAKKILTCTGMNNCTEIKCAGINKKAFISFQKSTICIPILEKGQAKQNQSSKVIC